MPRLPTDESSFFQILKTETLASIFWERLELKTDSGFPDTHFVLRKWAAIPCEGTIELKFQRKDSETLHTLMKGDQKANFLDYYAAGGRRRWVLVCNKAARVSIYNTRTVCEVLTNKRTEAFSSCDLYDSMLPLRHWLPKILEM